MTEQKDFMTKLGEKLNKLNVEEEVCLEIENKIDETVNQLNDLINKTIDGAKISEADVIKKLGGELTEEDIDKMLITQGSSAEEIANMPVNQKRQKAVEYLNDYGEAADEYDLAKAAKVASIKDKLAKALKSDISEKFNKSFKTKQEQIEKPVYAERNKLAKADSYQQQQDEIASAKADRVARKMMNKREKKRNMAFNAVGAAALSAVLDDCVEETRNSIVHQYDNAVTLSRSIVKVSKEREKDLTNNEEHYQEAEKALLEGLKEEYPLPKIKTGSDDIQQHKSNVKSNVKDILPPATSLESLEHKKTKEKAPQSQTQEELATV